MLKYYVINGKKDHITNLINFHIKINEFKQQFSCFYNFLYFMLEILIEFKILEFLHSQYKLRKTELYYSYDQKFCFFEYTLQNDYGITNMNFLVQA